MQAVGSLCTCHLPEDPSNQHNSPGHLLYKLRRINASPSIIRWCLDGKIHVMIVSVRISAYSKSTRFVVIPSRGSVLS